MEASEVMPMAKAAELVKSLNTEDGSMKNWISNPESSSAPQEVNVKMENGKAVGWCGLGQIRYQRQRYPLISVFVDTAHRGKGLGKELVIDVLKREQPDEAVYHDPDAPQLGEWIKAAGFEAEAIPKDAF
jgi:GNAT superfamily N-acetyltransferase